MCFYILLGLVLFYAQSLQVGTKQKPKEQIITMSLASYEPEILPPIELPLEEPLVEEVILEPVVEKKIITKKVIEQNLTKVEPVVKKIVKKKTIKKKITKKKFIKKKKFTKRKATRRKPASKKRASPAKKNAFLKAIQNKINKNKTYPRIAQRRGMQGSVKVRFTILGNGNVGNISVTGSKVFHKSARKAIKGAFPVNVQNSPVSLPYRTGITIRYRIR